MGAKQGQTDTGRPRKWLHNRAARWHLVKPCETPEGRQV